MYFIPVWFMKDIAISLYLWAKQSKLPEFTVRSIIQFSSMNSANSYKLAEKALCALKKCNKFHSKSVYTRLTADLCCKCILKHLSPSSVRYSNPVILHLVMLNRKMCLSFTHWKYPNMAGWKVKFSMIWISTMYAMTFIAWLYIITEGPYEFTHDTQVHCVRSIYCSIYHYVERFKLILLLLVEWTVSGCKLNTCRRHTEHAEY